MRKEFPWLLVRSAPNAVFWERECVAATDVEKTAWDIVCVGRLVADKKPRLLLQAFSLALASLPPAVRLVYVGTGPELEPLRLESDRLGITSRVHFMGHEARVAALRDIYGRAVVAVSPGYVGLSAIQAFAFGVPMLVADSEPHSPEIEACVAGFSAEFFQSDRPESLAMAIEEAFRRRPELLARRGELSRWTAFHYSFDRMVRAFEAFIADFTGLSSFSAAS
jgi:glycosyltransferase involved in cell wall biosynthesis